MERSTLHQFIAGQGPMTRDNQEIVRISGDTGFSTEQIYKVVIGGRIPSRACAIAITKSLKGRMPSAAEYAIVKDELGVA